MIVSEMMQSYAEKFCVMERRYEPDGEGGNITRWIDGMEFTAYTAHDTTILAQQAEGEQKASTFTFLIPAAMHLNYPDVVKRLADGETFQVTTDSNDLKTPATSSMGVHAVKARKWVLPA